MTQSGDKTLLLWDRYVSGSTAYYADVDLYRYHETGSVLEATDDKQYYNMRYSEIDGLAGNKIYKLKAESVPTEYGTSVEYAFATEDNFTELIAPDFNIP